MKRERELVYIVGQGCGKGDVWDGSVKKNTFVIKVTST